MSATSTTTISSVIPTTITTTIPAVAAVTDTSPDKATSTDKYVPNDCDTTLNFFFVDPPPGEKAFIYTDDRDVSKRVLNFALKAIPVTIRDVRGRESEFTLDKSGFQYLKHSTALKDWSNDEEIKSVYYKEFEEILKEVTGAKRVVVFDHMVRRNYNVDQPDPTAYNRPSRRVHVDQTDESAIKRARDNLPAEEAEELLKGRFQLINLWRAINYPAARFPFALVDYSTINPEKDLVKVTLKRPNSEGDFFIGRHNPDAKWYYVDKQTPDEPVLFKNYDSDTTKARLTVHSAFDQYCPPGVPHRESIEARALVFS